MKKIVCISGALLLAASACVFVCANKQNNDVDLFKTNVEALSDTESGLWGTCSFSSNECLGQCPHCKVLVYAPVYQVEYQNYGGLAIIAIKK